MEKGLPFWRVCRVLANRPRLRILGLLSRRPGLRVTEVAKAMKLSRPAASQYLRALESCGFVISRRIQRSIVYEVAGPTAGTDRGLLSALINRLIDKTSIEYVFKLPTAFANPGRIDVFRSLNSGARSIAELKASTGWAGRTVRRHLKKLESRGFIHSSRDKEIYESTTRADEFGRALAHAATS